MSQTYSRLPTSTSQRQSKSEAYKRRMLSERAARKVLANRITAKLHAFFWVAAMFATVYYTDMIRTLSTDPRVNRVFFNLGLVALGGLLVILLYVGCYAPLIQRRRILVNEQMREIKIGAVCLVIMGISFMIGMWPVYGLLTPVIELVCFFGCLFTAHFLPTLGGSGRQEERKD